MKVLAISVSGHEYMYKASTARKVSERSATQICDICNAVKYRLKPGECWYIHDVDKYDTAYDYAMYRAFTIRNGIVKDRSVNPF